MSSTAILCGWSGHQVLTISTTTRLPSFRCATTQFFSAACRTLVNDGSVSVEADAIAESSWYGGEAVLFRTVPPTTPSELLIENVTTGIPSIAPVAAPKYVCQHALLSAVYESP